MLDCLGGHSLLCARCSGIYLGFLVALIVLAATRKRFGLGGLRNLWLALVLILIVPIEVAVEHWLGADPGNFVRYLTGIAFGSGFARVIGVFGEQFFELPSPLADRPVAREWLQMAIAATGAAFVVILWAPLVFNGLVLMGLFGAYLLVNFIVARGVFGISGIFACLVVATALTAVEWGLLYWLNNFAKPLAGF